MALWPLTPERKRALRRVAINSAFGGVVFLVVLYIWFPYDRAKDVVIAMAAAQGLDVEIGSAGSTFGLGIAFKDIVVRTRPATGKPVRFTVEAARVTVSPLSLLTSAPAVRLSADVFGGELVWKQKAVKKGPFTLGLKASGLNLAELPGIKEAINLPVGGSLDAEMDLESTTGRYADAFGAISFKCEACVLGDGRAPLRVEGNPFLAGGLTLPRVRLGNLVGRVAIDKGLAKLQGVEAKSPDGELAIEGESQLRDPLMASSVNVYLRFKLSDALLKSADRLATILQMAGTSGKRADGGYGMRLTGSFAALSPPMFSATSQFGASTLPGSRPGARPGIAPSAAPRPMPAPAAPANPSEAPPPPPPPPPEPMAPLPPPYIPPEATPPPPPPDQSFRGTPVPQPGTAPTEGDDNPGQQQPPPAPPPAVQDDGEPARPATEAERGAR